MTVLNLNPKTKAILLSFWEGVVVAVVPLIYSAILGILPNYASGALLTISVGILNILYDAFIKKSNSGI